MSGVDRLNAALREASVTRAAVVAPGALAALPEILGRVAPERPVMIVADDNTWRAAGEAVAAIVPASDGQRMEPVVLSGTPRLKALADTARALAETMRARAAIPIAVGSGVINDVVKLAAEIAREPYVCVATAASMDGYAASGAAVIEHGFKCTLACRPPAGILVDLDVIAAAPREMTGWGYGDLAGKVVAGADWILADALEVEPIVPGVFAMVQDDLETWLSPVQGIGTGDRQALRGKVQGLLITGFAMQAHGNSRPASGSDHLFAHLWEMEGLSSDGIPVAHGACVGIGCLTMLHLYDWLLDQDVATLDIARSIAGRPTLAQSETEVDAAFPGEDIRRNALAEVRAKHGDDVTINARLTRVRNIWPDLKQRLACQVCTPEVMRQRLAAVGAPSTAEAIGIDPARLARDCRRARLIRRRYTILDLLDEAGWLDRAIAAALPQAVTKPTPSLDQDRVH